MVHRLGGGFLAAVRTPPTLRFSADVGSSRQSVKPECAVTRRVTVSTQSSNFVFGLRNVDLSSDVPSDVRG